MKIPIEPIFSIVGKGKAARNLAAFDALYFGMPADGITEMSLVPLQHAALEGKSPRPNG